MTHAAPAKTNEALWEMDRAHSLHPWTNFGPFEDKGALVITRGEGSLTMSRAPSVGAARTHVHFTNTN